MAYCAYAYLFEMKFVSFFIVKPVLKANMATVTNIVIILVK